MRLDAVHHHLLSNRQKVGQAVVVCARRDVRHGLQARRQNVLRHLGGKSSRELLAVDDECFVTECRRQGPASRA
mgnify:CR=1 FL=1